MGTKEFENLEDLVSKSRDEFNLVVSDACKKKSILELKEAKVQLHKIFLIKGVQLARMLIYDADQSKPDWKNGDKFEYSEKKDPLLRSSLFLPQDLNRKKN